MAVSDSWSSTVVLGAVQDHDSLGVRLAGRRRGDVDEYLAYRPGPDGVVCRAGGRRATEHPRTVVAQRAFLHALSNNTPADNHPRRRSTDRGARRRVPSRPSPPRRPPHSLRSYCPWRAAIAPSDDRGGGSVGT